MVGLAATPTGAGYWRVAADGGIFTAGDATFYGSTGNLRLNRPIVGMTPTPTGRGYWLVASDGGIFAFGDARFYGSTGNLRLNRPVVGMTATGTGKGWISGHLPEALGTDRVLFLAHRDELIQQLADHVRRTLGGLAVSIEQAGNVSSPTPCVIASVPTLAASGGRRLAKFKPGRFGAVVTDEVHHGTAESYLAVYRHLGLMREEEVEVKGRRVMRSVKVEALCECPRVAARAASRRDSAECSSSARSAVQRAASSCSAWIASKASSVNAWPTRQRNANTLPSRCSQRTPWHSGQDMVDGIPAWVFRSSIATSSRVSSSLREASMATSFLDGAGSGSENEHRVEVARDGSFRVAFGEKTRSGRFELDARYLYMDEIVRWKSKESTGQVVLEPKLGARIAGRVRLPAGTEASKVGGKLVLEVSRRSGNSYDSEQRGMQELSPDLTFAFDAELDDVERPLLVRPHVRDARQPAPVSRGSGPAVSRGGGPGEAGEHDGEGDRAHDLITIRRC